MPAPYRKLYLLYLQLMDLVLLVTALGVTIALNYSNQDYVDYGVTFVTDRVKVTNAVLIGLLLLIWHQAFNIRGLYLLTRLHLLAEEVLEIALSVFWCAIAFDFDFVVCKY